MYAKDGRRSIPPERLLDSWSARDTPGR
jgi:hypothetical protein